MKAFLIALIAGLTPAAAFAAPQVSLTSDVALVQTVVGPGGKAIISFEEPKRVTPGDRLRFTLSYSNGSGKPADNFIVTDPIPSGVVFAGNESPGAEMSVDGGKTFGPLGTLKLSEAGKQRAAVASDVTHIRWKFGRPIGANEHGDLRFEAIVR